MKNRVVTTIILINLAALLALAIFEPHLMIQPGKLIDAHQELTEDCFACHSPFFGSSPEKCQQCHKVAEIGLKTTKGVAIEKEQKSVAFHQQLIEDDCVACHADHKGVQAYKPIGSFSHELVMQEMRERCDGCHSKPGDALHQKIKGNCGQCHTIEGWLPATFEHEQYFRFDRHHPSDCEKCHVQNDYSTYTCYGCHEHSRSKIREEHLEEGIRDYENCVECHRSGDEDEAKYRMRSLGRGGEGDLRGYRREHEEEDDD